MPSVLLAAFLAFALLPAAHAEPTPAAMAEGVVASADSADAVPGSYIVVLKEAVAPQLLVGDNLTRAYDSLPAFAARLSPLQARRLAANPAVAIVEQDQKIKVSGTQRDPAWNLDRIDQRSRALSTSYTPSNNGSSVHAYVIDTGIRITHQQFGGRASYGYDFVDRDRYAGDCNGHGTHVAGTLGGTTYGVAKKVRLVSVRVLDCHGDGTTSDVITGIAWVTAHAVRPAVANLSLGGVHSAALDYAVKRSIASGITYAVAAGNEGESAYYSSPADVPEALTVAASDSWDRRPYWSNYGGYVDLFAPGVGIKSAGIRSDAATATMSGTSMAAPHVAGAAAMVLDAYPKASPAQVRAYLIAHATTGVVSNLAGSPNRLLYVTAPPKVLSPQG
jgi:subtilisin family serine protease